jgi:hypothetical protein
MIFTNDCQFCLSTAPLDRRGTISNPASMPIAADRACKELGIADLFAVRLDIFDALVCYFDRPAKGWPSMRK